MSTSRVNWVQELRKYVLKGKLEDINTAIVNGADINHIYKGGWSLAHFCARCNRCEILKEVARLGGNLGVQKEDGSTPLHIASSNGFVDLVRILISSGVNIHAKNLEGNTALHISCYKGCKKVTEMLVAAGSKVSEVNNRGETALHLAALNGEVGTMKALYDKSDSNNYDKVDINAQTLKGNTALHFAVFFEKSFAEKFLLSKGADITIKNRKGVKALSNSRYSKKRCSAKTYKSRKRPHRTLLPEISPQKNVPNQVEGSNNLEASSARDQYDWERYAKRLKAILDTNEISSPPVSLFCKNKNENVRNCNSDLVGPETNLETNISDMAINPKRSLPKNRSHIRKLFNSPIGIKRKIQFSIIDDGSTVSPEDRENTSRSSNLLSSKPFLM